MDALGCNTRHISEACWIWESEKAGLDCVCLYLHRQTRRVCPGYYPLERPARLSISATIRLELELGAMDEALDGASVELRSVG